MPAAGANPPTVTIDATLVWPAWVGVDTLSVYMNTPNTSTPSSNDGNNVRPVAYATFNMVSGQVTDTAGQPVSITAVTLTNGENGLSYFKAGFTGLPIALPSTTDAWILLAADVEQPGTKTLFPIVPVGTNSTNGAVPFALYNAIYLDVNGNGVFDAPGISTSAASIRAQGVRRIKQYDATQIPPEGTPDIRAQFEALSRGECTGGITPRKGQMDQPDQP